MKRDFSALASTPFDVLICGGGIYGAWTAYDAALRGLKVALVEQNDWASATSSASSKLIHGGLRYLETYDFRLVRKALKERNMLLHAAPHRVWPLRFGVPIYRHSRMNRLQLKAGLILYDMLAVNPNIRLKHRYFNHTNFAARFPQLSEIQLNGGFTYADAQTDDARLVLELVAGAMAAGAVCVNYCKLAGITESNAQATGAKLQDQLTGEISAIQAQAVVYTSGQWLTENSVSQSWCRLSKGVHIVLPAMLQEEALLLTARADGRVFFMIPWYGLTLVGTTDNDYSGDVNNVTVEAHEVAYLLREVNNYLNTSWSENDVLGSYAGVRVLQQSNAATPSAVSRDWEYKIGDNGVFYSVGGKLTSAREDAATLVNALCKKLGRTAACATYGRPFPWAPQDFAAWSVEMLKQAGVLQVDAEVCHWLMRRHGLRTAEILYEVGKAPALARRIVTALPFIYADLVYCAQHEMVVHLGDLLRRRIPLFVLHKISMQELLIIAKNVSVHLGWDERRVQREVENCVRDFGLLSVAKDGLQSDA
ncbi:MAG: glycerol-3-phosphate dehydrogenase/oxidase [Gallionellaceae bacterium]|jgi:glycerol-3-phosphate dehydrogenase